MRPQFAGLPALHALGWGPDLVVDNASTDSSAEAIRLHPLSVTLLENEKTLVVQAGSIPVSAMPWNLDQDFSGFWTTMPRSHA